MIVYFDTEFTGLHQHTTLISIGCVDEVGRSFYAEFTDYAKDQIDAWLQENIINKLLLKGASNSVYPNGVLGDTAFIKQTLGDYLSQYGEVQMVSDCLSYDWVLFCQIWGHAFKIPSNISPAPYDINQDIAHFFGVSPKEAFNMSRESIMNIEKKDAKHNALWDAQIIKDIYRVVNKTH